MTKGFIIKNGVCVEANNDERVGLIGGKPVVLIEDGSLGQELQSGSKLLVSVDGTFTDVPSGYVGVMYKSEFLFGFMRLNGRTGEISFEQIAKSEKPNRSFSYDDWNADESEPDLKLLFIMLKKL